MTNVRIIVLTRDRANTISDTKLATENTKILQVEKKKLLN